MDLAAPLRRLKYGRPIVVVSGLPRSGTSMMMRMLEAGGLPLMQDRIRGADGHNPNGYFEYERVKDLDKPGDKRWLGEARGKGIKIISFLLKHLPDDFQYKILFMRRDLAEIKASQDKMLATRGAPEDPIDPARFAEVYGAHVRSIEALMRTRTNFSALDVDYKQVLQNPRPEAERIAAFLGGGLDAAKMAEMADPKLYRNRA